MTFSMTIQEKSDLLKDDMGRLKCSWVFLIISYCFIMFLF